MYKQELKHKVLTEIRNDFPFIKVGLKFNDLFTEDTYVLVSDSKIKNIKHIPFSLFKNNEPLKECVLVNGDIDQLLEKAFSDIEDHDLKQIFFAQHKDRITDEVVKFMKEYEEEIILNEITLEGELRRMKQVAGMSKKLLV